MNNLSSKLFFIFIGLFISTLFSQDRLSNRVPDPTALRSQFQTSFPEERISPERPFNRLRHRPDFRNDRRPWLEKGNHFKDDYRWQFEPMRPSPPTILYKQMMDSVWVNYIKYTSTYDTNRNRTEWLYQRWENNVWVNHIKKTYTFDAVGNMTVELQQGWDEENNDWVIDWKWTYTFNVNGNMTEKLYQRWEDNNWVNWEKYTFTYDTNGNKTEELEQDWSGYVWENARKHTCSYDANGSITEELWHSWKNNAWVLEQEDTFTYDASGNLIEESWQTLEESVGIAGDNTLPKDFQLTQNYPNPFNPVTTLRYDLPERSEVVLTIYDILGRQVRTLVSGVEDPGFGSVVWDGTNDLGEKVSAGVYLYQIKARQPSLPAPYGGQAGGGGQAVEYSQTRKMLLLK